MKRFGLVLVLLLTLITDQSFAVTPAKIVAAGPGSLIHGVDISRWQHPGGKPIDFKKMYKAGIRFAIIKGSDSIDAADATAFKYLKIDRAAAQAVGIYTGFYQYVTLPDSTDPTFIATDAKAQAQKMIWRLASIGGYTTRDLPVALDLENNCVRKDASGTCTKFINRKFVTIWAQTWLDEVASRTGRKPFIYSYPQFLENAMDRSVALAQYPLWVAQYKLNPATSVEKVGLKVSGCYAHSWTLANCTTQWQFWQYTSCGIGSKYGIPTDRVDLNVFSGSSTSFYALTSGTWQPTQVDFLPSDEPTNMKIVSVTATSTKDPAQIVVDVLRPDGTPVVTGTVDFRSLDSVITSGTQRVVRSATGRWTVFASKLVAGHYLGLVEFVDPTGVHAVTSQPIEFDIAPGPTPSPTPKPTGSPTPKPTPTIKPTPTLKPTPTPVDACKGQIRN